MEYQRDFSIYGIRAFMIYLIVDFYNAGESRGSIGKLNLHIAGERLSYVMVVLFSYGEITL